MSVSERVIYCLFGDFQAIEVVTAAAKGVVMAMKTVKVLPAPSPLDGVWIYSTHLVIDDADVHAVSFVIIKPELNNDVWFMSELGVNRAACLRVVGGEESKYQRSRGLMRFIPGAPNEVHLRSFGQLRLVGGLGLRILKQVLQSFVVDGFSNRRRVRSKQQTIRIPNSGHISAPYDTGLIDLEVDDQSAVIG